MGTLILLQKTLERLNEAKTEKKCVVLQQNRATLDLLQTLEKLAYVKIVASGKTSITVEPTKTATAYGETKISVVKKKNLRMEAAKQVPNLLGILLIYTRRGVMSHEEAIKTGNGGHAFVWCC